MGASSKITLVNPNRVQWCLDEYQVSVSALAKATSIADSTINDLLQGKGEVSFKQLKAIADYFRQRLTFFFSNQPISTQRVDQIRFRKTSSQNQTLQFRNFVKKATEVRQAYIDLLDEFREANDLVDVKFTPPEVSHLKPQEAGSLLRKWLGINGRAKFTEFRSAIEAKGVLVLQASNYAGSWKLPQDSDVLGISMYFDSLPIIVVRKLDNEARQSFTLMHELAHLVLHKSNVIDHEAAFDPDVNDLEEKAANICANYLLIPAEFDSERLPMVASHEELTKWLSPYKNRWGASIEAFYVRLLLREKISVKIYREYRDGLAERLALLPKKDGGGNRVRHKEPTQIFGEGYTRLVLDAWRSDSIDTTKASKLLDNLKLVDLHKLRGRYEAN